MSVKTFKLRPKAEEDLENIYQYSIEHWGNTRADEYIREISTAFLTLAENPLLGRDCSDIRPEFRAFTVASHVVFYKPSNSGVAVVRVLHQSMDCQKYF
ncbi:MAG TPA: type II toxin-antitoxin system RelE/ParE family toxin [Pseudomonadales bacterium]|nr:type II toxin-antitoxin system RelE/ParE family toxin [Pseudomonadales bacterium]